jgi:hypothetical protein
MELMPGVEDLARRVQFHVPRQPWGRNGYEPPPLEIWRHDDGHWVVSYVTTIARGKRRWGRSSGVTLEAALAAARTVQAAAPPPEEVP